MAYNKAKEEKKWRLWKEAEEKQLRKLGVDESTIETLRSHDWAIFNSDRRYYQRMQEAGMGDFQFRQAVLSAYAGSGYIP